MPSVEFYAYVAMRPLHGLSRSGHQRRKPQPPSTTERMADSLRIWRCDLDRPDIVKEVLRYAGFGAVEISALQDIAVAATRKRQPHRP